MDVRTLCLAVLTKGDATGYEIKKMFEEGPFAHFQSASFGSIYPALSRLLSEGLVEARAQEQDGRPDKKVYSITPAGNALVDAALTVTPEADTFRSDFLFLLFFATRLPEARVIELIDQRVDMYRAKQNHIAEQMAAREQNDCTGDPGRETVAGFGISLYRAAADYLESQKGPLIAELRAYRARRPEAAE
ncbi:PadR family transcriptional regulator [Thalassobaculum sp. OXR-137]|uniref:PadR family transcriptional regulator n=1 Tax=Thalassobaculum sp. OXR-137 TaxID=3100173 RepID=UPI002AC89787|nr:PadR family transcriptional regulator [Thalassobaculum sp. OXR-137]WPZ33439.1 PadR family transcriptional regulator [Thalassobaculum sp. OXR-137]